MRRALLRSLVLFIGLGGPAVAAPPAEINYKLPPEPAGRSGVVRVWNSTGGPRLTRDFVPEVRIGQTVIVEVKDVEQWLAANLDLGAWSSDPQVVKASPAVRGLIEKHLFASSMRAGRWLAAHPAAASGQKPEAAASEPAPPGVDPAVARLQQLRAAIAAGKDGLNELSLPMQGDGGAVLNPEKPEDAKDLLARFDEAAKFSREFTAVKTQAVAFVFNDARISDVAVGKLSMDRDIGRATYKEFYSTASFLLESPTLAKAVGTRFSIPGKVSLAIGEQIMETSVIPGAEDSRCRFELLAPLPPAKREPRTFTVGDQVYPLDEKWIARDGDRHFKKAEIVEVNAANPKPYTVHFLNLGGTKPYEGSALARLPPDPVVVGVVRVWNEQDPAGASAQNLEVPRARKGDRLVVEVRNFDGWLSHALDLGYFRDEAYAKAREGVRQFIDHKQFWAAVRTAGWLRNWRDNDSVSSDVALIPDLKKLALESPKYEALMFYGALDKAATSEMEAQTFFNNCREALSLLLDLQKVEMRKLTLAINDISLEVVPDNADYAPVPERRRPPGDPTEDTYNWLSYFLADKPEKAGAVGGATGADAPENPWKRILASPKFEMPSKISLTLVSNGETVSLPTAVTKDAVDPRCQFALIGIEFDRFVAMVVVFVIIIGSLLYFTVKTDILRDSTQRCPDGLEPVSLARLQMAFWFVFIALAFAFLWVVTGSINTINVTCLTLLGIGTTTAAASLAIEAYRSRKCETLTDVFGTTTQDMLRLSVVELEGMLREKKVEIEKKQAALQTAGGTPEAAEELAQMAELLDRERRKIADFRQRWKWLAAPRLMNLSYRFHLGLNDLLSEDVVNCSYDFHRFQMLAWTLVLGFIFIFKVLSDKTMPVFESNLLLLMGISSGAYVTLKAATPRTKPAASGDKPDGDKPPAPEGAGT
ncbi:MAG TPA: hypothetical protein VGO11_10145 [Chthoniobacteraceae bacterium]|jgi:hypothetical protein|nr:hypothetical protein [Chthoniobacteraceae bacterium]